MFLQIVAILCVGVWIATWVGAIWDMNRRADMSWMRMVIWIAVIVIFPLVGLLAYMIFRPSPDKIRYKGENIE